MSSDVRAPPGPLGELTALPQTPSCIEIETPRAFGARSRRLRRLASRLRRSETERSGRFFFFPIQTLSGFIRLDYD